MLSEFNYDLCASLVPYVDLCFRVLYLRLTAKA